MKLLDSNEELIDQLYEDTDQFFNEIAFFKGDITFLRQVIDNYFRNLTRIEKINHLQVCIGQFKDMEIIHSSLLQQLMVHLSRIEYASKQESTVMVRALLAAHLNFSIKIKQFISDYLLLRAKILSIAEPPLNEGEDLNSSMFSGHLLSPN
ncbi:hypothetical protein [Muriicola sp. Z0-33]|uniref:hypothetical protein n=1 Tax=Muriicola sp. Z0-33 TaxID=2816957 RepID=UPI00223781B2|nr:hypothetical protein [Muriicola sp. Z0-33]MCW5515769.1 hypothetical protein [Muriicola sp. Z0-33]